jgi:serine/threonine-protein kinase HipA
LNKALGVWWDGARVGNLIVNEHGEMEFAYDKAWLKGPNAKPLSLSLPLREERFNRRDARPFFAGLLPEADVRKGVARNIGVSEQNDFGLLDRLGGDVAGALTLLPTDQVPAPQGKVFADTPLDDDELIKLIEKLPREPFLATQSKGVRLSLAGAQNKIPVVLVDGRVALPEEGQATTHILKPAIRDLDFSTENEAFAMRLALITELDVALAEPIKVKDHTYLLVRRYDRDTDENGQVHKMHQEDFCQAMKIAPECKYSDEGGPTFKTSFALLREAATRPAVDTLRLLDAAIFNLTIGNADAHGKNFSLLYEPHQTRLAPLYDLMCTAVYPHVTTNLAMRFAKINDLKDFSPKIWERFAADVEIAPTYVRKRVQELSETIGAKARGVAEVIAQKGFNADGLHQIATLVEQRSADVRAGT